MDDAEGAALVPTPHTTPPPSPPRRRGTLLPPTSHELTIARAAAVVAPLWFGAQLAFNTSLNLTSVTSNTVLSSASAALTYAASVLVLKERPTLRKAMCVGVTMGGVAAVAVADGVTRRGGGGGGGSGSGGHTRTQSLAGDALTLLASGLYAAYTIALRRMLGEEGGAGTVSVGVGVCVGGGGGSEEERGGGGDAHHTHSKPPSPPPPSSLQMLFFGCIGAINLVAGAPVVAVAALVTHAHLPSRHLIALALAKGLLDNALSDYLWARAVLLVGPTAASVGLNAQVPLAAALDAIVSTPRPPWTASVGATLATAAGAVAVMGGVVGMATAADG